MSRALRLDELQAYLAEHRSLAHRVWHHRSDLQDAFAALYAQGAAGLADSPIARGGLQRVAARYTWAR